MRYGSAHKAETRSRIITAAAQIIRENGSASAVVNVMARAGLTHGGFYAHFASKEELVAEAVDAMFADARQRTPALAEALADEAMDPRAALRAYLTSYLSPQHRDEPDRGCPLPALSADMARHAGGAKTRFACGLKDLIGTIDALADRLDIKKRGVAATAIVAQMVGALSLARAVGPGSQSDAILQNSLADLLARLGL